MTGPPFATALVVAVRVRPLCRQRYGLLKGQDAETVFSYDGLLPELKKTLAERMLDAEMDEHLDSEEEQATGNRRRVFRCATRKRGSSAYTSRYFSYHTQGKASKDGPEPSSCELDGAK